MLTRIEAVSAQGNILNLPLGDTSSGIVVAEIEGLDPVKATLVSSSSAGQDGETYHSSRREARNIVLHLEIKPDYITRSVREIRKQLYGFFMPKSEVKFRFFADDDFDVDISGIVESCDSPLFTKEPTMGVSIMCGDPDFVDQTPGELSGTTVSTTTDYILTYEGEVETGVVFTLNVDRTLSEFTIYHTAPDGTLRQLDFAHPLEAGDVLTISTVFGSKGARLLRAGSTSSVLRGVSPQSNWIELQPGDNHLRVYATGTAIPFNLEWNTKYGGL